MLQIMKGVLVAALLSAAGMGAAGAETTLRTLATAHQNRGWEAVGRLDLGDAGFCTASLITVDLVLTAAHCLFDKDTGGRIDPGRIEFQAGLRFGRAEAYRGVHRIVIHPGYVFGDPDRVKRIGHDLALLELDRGIRLARIHPFRTQFRVETGQGVQVVSYARDRADAPSREEACSILTRDESILVLSCEADFGASGAPVFAMFDNERRIVSVISAKARWQGQDVSLAARSPFCGAEGDLGWRSASTPECRRGGRR